ncbi:DEAD/DEAH box helicase [Candidatus Dependentiae bacterium]|nr:MAG: DEAD/DEAH box helicase [Candidatus Dependentiae bacterium]
MELSPIAPHQENAISFILRNPYSICAVSMGGGKSRIAIESRKKLGLKAIISCPSYLKLEWEQEIKKWDSGAKYFIDKGTVPENVDDYDIVVTSYGRLKHFEKHFPKFKLVVIDEGQNMKNMAAKRTIDLHRLVYENSIPRVVVLSGTIIKNRVAEFYANIALCNYNPKLKSSPFLEKFPDAVEFADRFSYRKEYSIEIRNRMVKILTWEGHKNVPELKEYLKGIYYKVSAEEFLTVKEVSKVVQISESEIEELAEEFEKMEMNPDSIGGKAKRMSAEFTIPSTISYVKDLLNVTDRVIIYTDYVEVCNRIAEAFGVPAITGEMQPLKRKAVANKFIDGKYQVLVATIPSFSTGVNLQCANHMVFNDVCWSAGDLDQAKYRIKRIGQKEICYYHYISGSPQNSAILEKLDSKIKTIGAVT